MKTKSFFLTALLGVFLYACESVTEESITTPSANQVTVTVIDTINDVNLDVIKHVAETYTKKTQTRNSAVRKIKEIVPVNDEQGDVSMYIINYENNQGYLILSGTNEYQPVLAFSDRGNFDVNHAGADGASVWLQEQQSFIGNIALLLDSVRWLNKKVWNKFFEREATVQLNAEAQTRSGDAALEKEISDYIEESLAQWRREGYTIYPYSALSSIFSGSELDYVNETIHNHAEDRYCGGLSGTVFLITKKVVNDLKKGPFLQSQWGQTEGYEVNNYPAGCTAVAMGQIMRYHEYPVLYNWSAMAYNYPTAMTVQLLTEIGKKVNMDYSPTGSGAATSDVCSAFKQYGYSQVKIVTHTKSRTEGELSENCPVYMTGTNNGTPVVAHAWVCDGLNNKKSYEDFDLMVLDAHSPELVPSYYSIYKGSIKYTETTYLHMNWGWSGSNNGYFYEENVNPSDFNFSTNRKDIVDISPSR